MKKLSMLISGVFHPFFVPIYILLVLFTMTRLGLIMSGETIVATWLICVSGMIILPILTILIMKKFKIISEFSLDKVEDRPWPLMATSIYLIGAIFLLNTFPNTELIIRMMIIIMAILSIFTFITLYWKISMHSLVWGVFCGFILPFGVSLRGVFMLGICCAGAVAASRLYLGKHTIMQVTAGFLFGMVATMLLMFI